MKPLSKEAKRERLKKATKKLMLLDFVPFGGWLFFKSGNVYDLSAADLNQIERIENEGLFIVTEYADKEAKYDES